MQNDCCGFCGHIGLYSLFQVKETHQVRQQKVSRITVPEPINVSICPSCLLVQISDELNFKAKDINHLNLNLFFIHQASKIEKGEKLTLTIPYLYNILSTGAYHQFSKENRYYFSILSLENILAAHQLAIKQTILADDNHLTLQITHQSYSHPTEDFTLAKLKQIEYQAGIDDFSAYTWLSA